MNRKKSGSPLAWQTSVCVFTALLSTTTALVLTRHSREMTAAPSSLMRQPTAPAVVSLQDFHAYVENRRGLILDARHEAIYRQGHVPGAFSLPAMRFQPCYDRLKSRLQQDRNQPIILYCDSLQCDSSEKVASRLIALGYTRVSIFKEGWMAWQEAELPQEKSTGTGLPPWKPKKG